MKRVKWNQSFYEECQIYDVEDFIYERCKNATMSKFLRIQFDKGLITFDELLEILGLEGEKNDIELIDW